MRPRARDVGHLSVDGWSVVIHRPDRVIHDRSREMNQGEKDHGREHAYHGELLIRLVHQVQFEVQGFLPSILALRLARHGANGAGERALGRQRRVRRVLLPLRGSLPHLLRWLLLRVALLRADRLVRLPRTFYTSTVDLRSLNTAVE